MSAVLETRDLRKVFSRKGSADVVAVEGASLRIEAGECLGLVGESGSGKTTLARMALLLEKPTSGRVLLQGEDVTGARGAQARRAWRRMQAVFQNPAGSFDPRCTLGAAIAEPLRTMGVPRREAQDRVAGLLGTCGLSPSLAERYPRQVSGGQCQRAAIARALAVGPDLLVCDEATSALDATVQRQIVELLGRLRAELGMSMLFICHDIALVGSICDRVAVMNRGAIVEQGPVAQVLEHPRHPYTKTLIDAVL